MTPTDTRLAPSDDAMREHAYLVARGVRPLALAGHCEATPEEMLRVATRVETLGDGTSVPFVVDRGDGWADYGYAAAGWVVDLFEWVVRGGCPPAQRHRIIGLLLGYAPAAVREHDELGGGRRFESPTCRCRLLPDDVCLCCADRGVSDGD